MRLLPCCLPETAGKYDALVSLIMMGGGQGLGRLSEADINTLLDEKLAALSQILGEKKFLLGQQPCVADAAAFGFFDK